MAKWEEMADEEIKKALEALQRAKAQVSLAAMGLGEAAAKLAQGRRYLDQQEGLAVAEIQALVKRLERMDARIQVATILAEHEKPDLI